MAKKPKEKEKTPGLENPKYELFAQYIASGETNKEAYIKAGYSASGNPASGAYRLYHKTDKEGNFIIKDRVIEIKLEKLEQIGFDKLYITSSLKSTIERLKIESITAEKASDRIQANKILIENLKDVLKFIEVQEMKKDGLLDTEDEYAKLSDEDLDSMIKALGGK